MIVTTRNWQPQPHNTSYGYAGAGQYQTVHSTNPDCAPQPAMDLDLLEASPAVVTNIAGDPKTRSESVNGKEAESGALPAGSPKETKSESDLLLPYGAKDAKPDSFLAKSTKEAKSGSLFTDSAKDAKSNSSFKMQSSGPKNSVGELAAMLARSETVMDVQQVFSKAMRALADLKMGAIASEGKDAKKYAQQVKRMEKLIKRIQKKLKHLSKEQTMEEQAKKAAKKAEFEKEKQIRQELQTRRKKRRRDEKEYALKEMAQDGKDSTNEMISSMVSAASPSADPSALTGIDGSMMSADLSGMDLGGLDLMA